MQHVNRRWWERFRCVSAGHLGQVSPTASVITSPGTNTSRPNEKPDAALPTLPARRPLGGRHSHPGGHRGSRLDPSRQEAAGCGRSPEGGRQALRRSDGGAPSQSSWFKSAHGLSAACPPPKGLGLPDCGASSGRQAAHLSTPVERSALALHGAKATSPAQPRQSSGHLPVPMEGASPFMNREKGLLGGGGPSEGAVELPSRSILPACCRNFSRSRDSRPNCSLCARHFSSSSRTRHCGRGARSQPAPGGGGARVRGSAPCPCVLRAMCACGLCARVCMCRERARVHCGHLCACRGACVCAVVRVHVSCVGQAASSLHMEQRRVTPSLPHSLAVGQVPS